MKNYVQILAITLLLSIFKPCLAQETLKGKFHIQPYVAYSQSDLKWSIAGNKNGTDPNVLSELEWKRLKGPQFGLALNYGVTDRIVAKVDFSVMDIASGRVEDTDYSQDNRQGVFYQELFEANKGTDLSLRATAGYTLWRSNNFSIGPFLGYDLRKQNLFLLGREGVAEQQALKSTYKNSWQGVVLGTAAVLKVNRLDFGLNLSASLLEYDAKANWNLIEDFQKPVSFRHSSNGYSLRGQLKAGYLLTNKFSVELNFGSIYANALKGTDEAYYVSRAAVQTQLNEVKSFTYAVGAGVSYCF